MEITTELNLWSQTCGYKSKYLRYAEIQSNTSREFVAVGKDLKLK